MQAKCINAFGNLGKSQSLVGFEASSHNAIIWIANIQGEYLLVVMDILCEKHFIAGKSFLSNTDFGLESNKTLQCVFIVDSIKSTNSSFFSESRSY